MEESAASRIYKALGDPSRLAIVRYLAVHGETCACRFLEIVGCGQPTLSHHLSVLSKAGLVASRKDGNRVLYVLNGERLDEAIGFLKGN